MKYSSESVRDDHFVKRDVSAANLSADIKGFDSMFSSAGIRGGYFEATGFESFGKDINNSTTDAKIAITVTLLKFHKSIINRLIPNRPEMTNVVVYNVENIEVYDLMKSKDNASSVRDGDHVIPFIDLYSDPSPANTAAKPIELLLANDVVPAKLFAANMPFVGMEVNMFDYALNLGQVGYNHIDYTDLVNEGGRLKNIILKVTDGADTEYVAVNVLNQPGSSFLMASNTNDAAERVCALRSKTNLTLNTVQMSGVDSVLLAGLTVDAFVEVNMNVQGLVNIRKSNLNVLGSCEVGLKTISGTAPVAADANIFNALTISVVAYEPKFEYSEENVRKTSTAMRIINRQRGYEIPGNKSVVTQFSLAQTRPETVINSLSQLISIGNDDRALKLILDSIDNVYNRLQQEATFGENDYAKKVLNDFVAGHICNPSIYRTTYSLKTHLANMRSGEIWGDLRGLAEKLLLEVITRINQESKYMQALDAGEKQEFNVLTSPYILTALLGVPHYHAALGGDQTEGARGEIEFRRVLPNGSVLNVITTTFTYMQDRMLMLPVRPSKPKDVLNYAHNIDLGTFVAQVVPFDNGAFSKQVIANGREFPIITNPVAALIQFKDLTEVFDGIGVLGI